MMERASLHLGAILKGRWVGIAVALGLLVPTMGCQRAADENSQQFQLIVAGTETAGSPGARIWQHFADRYAESGAETELRPLIYGQLGSEEQILSGLRRGRIHLATVSALSVAGLVPEIAILSAPYLFDDADEADRVLAPGGELRETYTALLAERDLVALGFYQIGAQHVYSKRERFRPEDFRGVRFRVSASPAAHGLAAALGADRITLPFSDVVPALQTGLVEAGENAIPYYAGTGISEQAPYLLLTGHAIGLNLIVASRQWWEQLSAPRRQDITAALMPESDINRLIRDDNAATLADAQAQGIHVHRPTASELEAWRATGRASHPEIISAIGSSARHIYDRIQIERQRGSTATYNASATYDDSDPP